MCECKDCANHTVKVNDKGWTVHRCIKYEGVKRLGKLGSEPIIKYCGEYEKIKEENK